MKNAFRLIYTFLFLLALSPVFSQNKETKAPANIQITSITTTPGDTLCLEILASNISDVYLFQFALQWDPAALHFLSAATAGCPDAPAVSFGTSFVSEGHLIVLGGSPGPGFMDGGCLFRLCFVVDSTAWGTSIVQQYPMYQVEFLNTNGQSLPYSFMPGAVTISTLLQLANVALSPAGCQGAGGGIEVDIIGGQLPYVFQWSDTLGFFASDAQLKDLAPGIYFLEMTDQSGQILRDTFEVKSSGTPLDIRASTVKHATCKRPNGCIHLQVSGGAPPLSVRWADDPLAPPARCDLWPGVYRVEISDTAGCTLQLGFSVNDLPGFMLERLKDKPACDQPGFIELQPKDGIPPYRTLWNTGDTTLTLTDLEVDYYHVTVTDAQGCSVEKDIALHDNILPLSYGWENNFDCPQIFDAGTLEMNFGNLNPDLLPLTIDWYFGKRDTIWANDPANAEVTLRNISPGLQYNVMRQADGCAFVGGITLDCRPQSDVTDAEGAVFLAEQSGVGCSRIICKDCADVTDLQGTIAWLQSDMQLDVLDLPDSSGMYAWNFYPDTALGQLSFFWHTPDSLGHDLSELFEVCFVPKDSNVQHGSLTFVPAPVGILLRQGNGREMPVTAVDGPVVFTHYFTEFELYGGKVISPGCAADGKREFGAVAYPWFVDLIYYIFPIDGQTVPYQEINRASRLDNGYYSIYVVQPIFGAGGALLFLPPEQSDPCVWPGDTDNNGAVNHYDLLHLGLSYNAAGPARTEQGTTWSGFSAVSWNQTIMGSGVDYQNIDTDGNGLVNAADTLAIVQNWSRVIDQLADSPYEGPIVSPQQSDAPDLFVGADTILAGQEAVLPLVWGTAANPVDQAIGLAFTLRYDTNMVSPDLRFEPETSWFGDTTALLWIQRNFRHWGLLSVSITRLDGKPAQGHGAIGNLLFTAGALSVQDTLTGTWDVFKPLALGNDAYPLPLNAQVTNMAVFNPQSGAQELGGVPVQLILRPNPAVDKLWVETPGTQIEHIALFNTAGHCVLEMDAGEAAQVAVPVRNLPEGLYVIRVRTDNGIGIQKLTIIQN